MHSREGFSESPTRREFQDNPAARDQNYDETLKEMRMRSVPSHELRI